MRCPLCQNHCDENHLSCNKGKNYFNINTKEIKITESISKEKEIIERIKALANDNKFSTIDLMVNLKDEEIDTLLELLRKVKM